MPKHREPVFVTNRELAAALGVTAGTINSWVALDKIPPPHSRPGKRTALWLRRHFERYRETGEWPKEAFIVEVGR